MVLLQERSTWGPQLVEKLKFVAFRMSVIKEGGCAL